MLINKINKPADLKEFSIGELTNLAQEIREGIIYRTSVMGGHVGSNLGFVECTIAMHYVFDSPKDKIVFDVSHQCYAHKILTGRKQGFFDEQKMADISGYTTTSESEHDHFCVGHTSTSISLATGLCLGRDLSNQSYNVIAVIGDGSLSGGEALEGLDFAGEYKNNLIIVVNDNQMSISDNHGGIYKNLKLLRESNGSAQNNIFKDLGLDYLFVADGNDINALINAFSAVKNTNHPTVVHICTQKGKGYTPAENDKERWHWHAPYNVQTSLNKKENEYGYVQYARDLLLERINQNPKIAIICAGTPGAIGFFPEYKEKVKGRFIDVGIAEEHAVALASGMAKSGVKPIFCVQSSFLQRCYDQLSQDLALNSNPAVIIVYSSGIYPMRDATHMGVFDLAYTSSIPNLTYICPTNASEFKNCLDYALNQNSSPIIIRLPMTAFVDDKCEIDFSIKSYQISKLGSEVALLGLGNHFEIAKKSVELLQSKGINATLVNPLYADFVDEKSLDNLVKSHKYFVVIEDGVLHGGFGQKVSAYLSKYGVKTLCYGYKKEFMDRFDVNDKLLENRMREDLIVEDIISLMK